VHIETLCKLILPLLQATQHCLEQRGQWPTKKDIWSGSAKVTG